MSCMQSVPPTGLAPVAATSPTPTTMPDSSVQGAAGGGAVPPSAGLGQALADLQAAVAQLSAVVSALAVPPGGGPGQACPQAGVVQGASGGAAIGAPLPPAQMPVPAPAPAPAPAPLPPAGPGALKLVNPLPDARISSHFGATEEIRQGRAHGGLDLAIGQGTPILAAAAGTVAEVREEPNGYGHYITIDHGDGRFTRYAHMVERSPLNPGDAVTAGQEIGKVGSTGNSTGPHLHLEVLVGGMGGANRQDPEPYVFGDRLL